MADILSRVGMGDTPTRPRAVIDWPRMLEEMQHLLGDDLPGSTVVRIPIGTRALAVHLGYHRELVRSWLNGTVPKHPEGEWIILRWSALAGKPRAMVPMTEPVFSASRV